MTSPDPLAIDDEFILPSNVLTATLALSLWVGSGSFLLTILNGLGDAPGKRVAVGITLLALTAAALICRTRVTAVLQRHPRLTVGVAAVQIAAAGVDGVVGGAFVAFSLTSIGIAVVVAQTRTVWLCVLVLITGYLVALAAGGHSLAQLSDDGQLGGVIGALVGYPVAAILFLGLRQRFVRFLTSIDGVLTAIRADGDGFSPGLRQLLHGEPLGLPAPEAPGARLTPTERRVVEALADGQRAASIAYEWGVKMSTVRTHIQNAKKKTGARTLPELASFATRPDWETATDATV